MKIVYLTENYKNLKVGTALTQLCAKAAAVAANREPHLLTHTRYKIVGSHKTVDVCRLARVVSPKAPSYLSSLQASGVKLLRCDEDKIEVSFDRTQYPLCKIVISLPKTLQLCKQTRKEILIKLNNLLDRGLDYALLRYDREFLICSLNKQMLRQASEQST